ncbi:MAG: hypothetical protein J6K26_00720 [Lachnospiraceae bacterium]|nr:hypothetical protein [Lachnospiraceae bacterium]
MKNYEWCVYTYKHRRAFEYVAKRLIKDDVLLEKILERGKMHDLDKQLLYLFLEWDDCVQYHITHRSHHPESGGNKTYEDYVEMVIDYECSPYTKPDKPLNAYDFVSKLMEKKQIDEPTFEILMTIMKELEIDCSYDVTKEQQCIDFLNSLEDVTEEMILFEVMEYVRTNPVEELDYISDKIPGKSLFAIY